MDINHSEDVSPIKKMKSGKTAQYYWLKTELAKHFSELNFEKGVDLDRNGRIQDSERTDLNGDGKVDVSELKKFLKANKPELKNLGGFFKSFYSYGQVFKPDNPIHGRLYVESELATDDQMRATYQKVMQVLGIVKQHSLPMKPASKLETVYSAIRKAGLAKSGEENITLLTDGITKELLDCDTSSIVVLVVAHELDWPVFLVHAPQHMFVRWDDGSNKFNMDWGKSGSDKWYKKRLNVSSESNKREIYLKNLGPDEIWALNLATRAIAKSRRGDQRGAIADCTEALKQNPDMPAAYITRGIAKLKLGDLGGALADCEEAIRLDPNEYLAYNNRGKAKAEFGDLKGALADFDKTIKLNPNFSIGYYNRGNIKFKLGDPKGAIVDYGKAIALDPNSAKAYYSRGVAKRKLGRFIKAREDFLKAWEVVFKR